MNAVAGYDMCGDACVVVDFGTAINYDVVSRAGEYLGGIIGPGIEISIEALTSRAARLTKVDIAEPRSLIGKSTEAAIQSGIVYGFAAQVDGICGKLRAELGGERDDDRDRGHGERDRRVHREHRPGRRSADAEGPAARLREKPLIRALGGRRDRLTRRYTCRSPEGPFEPLFKLICGTFYLDAKRHRPHTTGLREAQEPRSSTSARRSAARSPSASRRRASSATSARTPSTTTPRTSRRCSRRASPRSRTSCATRP